MQEEQLSSEDLSLQEDAFAVLKEREPQGKKTKTPQELVKGNLDAAIRQLETAGARTFKAKMEQHLGEIQKLITEVGKLREKLSSS